VGDEASVEADSFSRGLLDHPHYTRPAEYDGREVPGVLLSGHHADVGVWRKREALARTLARRPDLLDGAQLDDDERRWLDEWGWNREGEKLLGPARVARRRAEEKER
jgi:tRNA (guanine37-N1)-methyltransferase